jgi:hypothetical protein
MDGPGGRARHHHRGRRLHRLDHLAEPDLRALPWRDTLLYLHSRARRSHGDARGGRRQAPDERPVHPRAATDGFAGARRHRVRRDLRGAVHGLERGAGALTGRGRAHGGPRRFVLQDLRLADALLRHKHDRDRGPPGPQALLPPHLRSRTEQPLRHSLLRGLRPASRSRPGACPLRAGRRGHGGDGDHGAGARPHDVESRLQAAPPSRRP